MLTHKQQRHTSVESVTVNPNDKQQITIILDQSTPVQQDAIIEIEYEYPGFSDADGRLITLDGRDVPTFQLAFGGDQSSGYSSSSAPEITSGSTDTSGKSITLNFTDQIAPIADTSILKNELKFYINGKQLNNNQILNIELIQSPTQNANTNAVAKSWINITLEDTSSIKQGDTIFVTYLSSQASTDTAQGSLKDDEGNFVERFVEIIGNSSTNPRTNTSAPSIINAEIDATASIITIDFDEGLRADAAQSLNADDFNLYIDGIEYQGAFSDAKIDPGDSQSIQLTIDPNDNILIFNDSNVLITFNDNDGSQIQSDDGNGLNGFAEEIDTDALSTSRDRKAPELVGSNPSVSTDGSTFTISFDEAIDNSDNSFSAAGFKLYLDGSEFTLNSNDVTLAQDGSAVEFSLNNGPKVYKNSQVLLAYDADSGTLEDAAQNSVQSFITAINTGSAPELPDDRIPSVTGTAGLLSSDGSATPDAITIGFDKNLKSITGTAIAEAFSVAINGVNLPASAYTISAHAGMGIKISLTDGEFYQGQTVTVTYEPADLTNQADRLQDDSGRDNFVNRFALVVNNDSATPPPAADINTSAPSIINAEIDATASIITIDFDEGLRADAAQSLNADDFNLYIDGIEYQGAFSDAKIDPGDSQSIQLTIDPNDNILIFNDSNVLITFNDNDGSQIQSDDGNGLNGFAEEIDTDALSTSRDRKAPELVGSNPSVSTDGSTFTISFDEAIDNSDNSFSAAGFKLYLDGSEFTLNSNDVTLAQDGSAVEFSLNNGPKVYKNSQVLLAYDADSGTLEDAAQNSVQSFITAINTGSAPELPDDRIPSVTGTAGLLSSDGSATPDAITIGFDKNLKSITGTAIAEAFSVAINGVNLPASAYTISAHAGMGIKISLTDGEFYQGQTVTVTYEPADLTNQADRLQDDSGRDNFVNRFALVVNNDSATPPPAADINTSAPSIINAEIDATASIITIDFDEGLRADAAQSLNADDFNLYIDGIEYQGAFSDAKIDPGDSQSIQLTIDPNDNILIFNDSNVLITFNDNDGSQIQSDDGNGLNGFAEEIDTDALSTSRDRKAPELVGSNPSVSTDGSTFTISFDEAIDNSDNSFSAAGFKLYLDGSEFTLNSNDVTLAQDGSAVEFSLNNGPKVYKNSQVLLAYDADSGTLEDAAQNSVQSFITAINTGSAPELPDDRIPSVTGTAGLLSSDGSATPDAITIGFDKNLKSITGTAIAEAFSVAINGVNLPASAYTISAHAGMGIKISLTDGEFYQGQTVTVTYEPADLTNQADRLQDDSGRDNFVNRFALVVNNDSATPPPAADINTSAPSIINAEIDATASIITIDFDEGLRADAAQSLNADDFNLYIDGIEYQGAFSDAKIDPGDSQSIQLTIDPNDNILIFNDSNVLITFNDNDGSQIQSDDGNGLNGFAEEIDTDALSTSRDRKAPELVGSNPSVSTDGSTFTISFDEAIDNSDNSFSAAGFKLYLDGSEFTLNSNDVTLAQDGSAVEFSLNNGPKVYKNSQVLLAYDADSGTLEDAAQNSVQSFITAIHRQRSSARRPHTFCHRHSSIIEF